jgi:hypothetical protein
MHRDVDNTILMSDELQDKINLGNNQQLPTIPDTVIVLLLNEDGTPASYGPLHGMQVTHADSRMELEMMCNVSDAVTFLDCVLKHVQGNVTIEAHVGETVNMLGEGKFHVEKCSLSDINLLKESCCVYVLLRQCS